MSKPLSFVREKYELLGQVGEGTYGQVYKAKALESGDLVALKKFRIETEKEGFSITAVREIKLLQRTRHSNIVNMLEIIMAQPPDTDVFLVFEYLEHDLAGLLHHPERAAIFSTRTIGAIIFQLLRGLDYLHREARIVHRDLKCSNILVGRNGVVKLADFGLAKAFCSPFVELGEDSGPGKHDSSPQKQPCFFTNRVITLWYRPPEVLLGSDEYGPLVDVWGLGCILAEMVLGKPAFSGTDEISQLEAILMGLSEVQIAPDEPLKALEHLPWYAMLPEGLVRYKRQSEQPSLRDRLREHACDAVLVDLILKMLAFNPSERLSAQDAIEHSALDFCRTTDPVEIVSSCLLNSSFRDLECKASDVKQHTLNK